MIPKKLHSFFSNRSVDEFKEAYPKAFNVLQPSHKSKHEIDKLIDQHPHSENFTEISYNNETHIEDRILSQRGTISNLHLNQIKMFYNMQKTSELLCASEKKGQHKYDWIIWARPDFKIQKEVIKRNKQQRNRKFPNSAALAYIILGELVILWRSSKRTAIKM